jgi:hypothetical protein
LYKLFSKFCSVNRNLYLQDTIYCSLCRSGAEIINLSGTPLCTSSILSNPASWQANLRLLPPAALIQYNTVNNRLKNIQNSCPNAGSSILSSRVSNIPCTTSQQFTFTIVLIAESFYYTSQEDYKFELPTVITRKHISTLLFKYCTIKVNLYFRQYCYSAS